MLWLGKQTWYVNTIFCLLYSSCHVSNFFISLCHIDPDNPSYYCLDCQNKNFTRAEEADTGGFLDSTIIVENDTAQAMLLECTRFPLESRTRMETAGILLEDEEEDDDDTDWLESDAPASDDDDEDYEGSSSKSKKRTAKASASSSSKTDRKKQKKQSGGGKKQTGEKEPR
jgi:hypothetical protein